VTAFQAGFHQVHMDVGQHGGMNFTQDTSAALANLATSTAADRETLAVLTKTITALMFQMADRDPWSKSQNDEIKRIMRINWIVLIFLQLLA
jgi:mannose/fructose/N-acetylgalactosamine-specific phosphotransferase system component IIC